MGLDKKNTELVIKRIEMVYTNAKKVAKMFKRDSISIKSFEGICSDLKIPVQEGEARELSIKLNEVFDKIAIACKAFAEDNDSTQIPLDCVQITVSQSADLLRKIVKNEG